jgi:hypothetical protein
MLATLTLYNRFTIILVKEWWNAKIALFTIKKFSVLAFWAIRLCWTLLKLLLNMKFSVEWYMMWGLGTNFFWTCFSGLRRFEYSRHMGIEYSRHVQKAQLGIIWRGLKKNHIKTWTQSIDGHGTLWGILYTLIIMEKLDLLIFHKISSINFKHSITYRRKFFFYFLELYLLIY